MQRKLRINLDCLLMALKLIKMDANEIERKCFRIEKNIHERIFSLQNLYEI